MLYTINLENYELKKIIPEIFEVNLKNLNFESLSDEILQFKKEIDWPDMWNIDDVKYRLETGWRFIVYQPNNKIKGWIWLDNKNEPKNIYVNKEYRNTGIAKELYFKIHNIAKELRLNKLEGSVDSWNISSIKSIKKAGWNQSEPLKIYIHHRYEKSLFYVLGHNTKNRVYNIDNGEGNINCEYKEVEIQFIFKKDISFETDGYHILDYFSAYFNNESDTKIGKIYKDRTFMERENQQILKIFIDLLKNCPKNQKWIITYFRTEKILHSIDSNSEVLNTKYEEIENLLNQLKNHHIVNDNIFLNNKIENIYSNFYFAFTNSIFQWNRNLNIRYYYELKELYDRLNFEYDLAYSVRNHKEFRVNLINELNKINNSKIYLQTSDTLGENVYFKKYGSQISNQIKLNSIFGNDDFSDISYLQNIVNGLDLFLRTLLKAKMQILCESWSERKDDFNSNYLSEKTIGFILAGIPFISTHDYPLLMLQKIFDIEPHPFLNESKKFKGDAKLFSNFVKEFMENFDENYKKCKEWSDILHRKFMKKLENENSLLKLIFEEKFDKNQKIVKNIL